VAVYNGPVNPWSLYTHKAEFIQSIPVGVIGLLALRRGSASGARSLAAFMALGWSLIGIVGWALYAFGHTLFHLSSAEVAQIQTTLEWIRVPFAVVGVLALYQLLQRVQGR
jgi:hypothetical protein